ncbi:MAG: glutaredoxin family protein [Flavobacteriales bacterium]|nr:glutaredoxin family protein [Flavobacteriales bacterium]
MKIKMYGADWCPDCRNAKSFLESKGVKFEYIIITDNDDAIEFLERVNNGKRIIPTLVVDGETHTNPGINGLMKILENKA